MRALGWEPEDPWDPRPGGWGSRPAGWEGWELAGGGQEDLGVVRGWPGPQPAAGRVLEPARDGQEVI